MNETATIQITVGNINQRQAIAIAVGKGLREAGFKEVSVRIEKCGDSGWDDMTAVHSESFLDTLKRMNPGVFDAPISVTTADPLEDVQDDDVVTLMFF